MKPYRPIERLLYPPAYVNHRKLARQLQGKTVLITGASSGIGEQLAQMLSEFEVHLILVARREDKLFAMLSKMGEKKAKASVYGVDLRERERVEGLLADISELYGGVDIVINNAGHSIRRSVYASLDRYHDYARTMAINYFAPVQLLLSLIPELEKRQGHIINISSVSVLLLPVPYWGAYLASKSAFDIWFRSAQPELNARGIKTTTIYLPLVRTPMILPTKAYRKMPAMMPEHAAQYICRSMYTHRKKYQPWWLFMGQIASVLFGSAWERLALNRWRKEEGQREGD